MSETPGAIAASAEARAPGERAFLVLGSIGLAGFCVWWCSFFHFESMIGDDVALLDYFQQKGSILRLSVLSIISDKYRPVYFVLQHVVIRLFGGHYPLYFWLNVVIHAAWPTKPSRSSRRSATSCTPRASIRFSSCASAASS